MPDVICNTSPLQLSASDRQLSILPALTGIIIVPPAVLVELDAGIAKGFYHNLRMGPDTSTYQGQGRISNNRYRAWCSKMEVQ